MIKDSNILKCPISKSRKFEKIFTIKKFPIYMGVVKKNYKYEYKDINYYINRMTGTVQIYPRVPLKKLYFKSHGSGKIGGTWKSHHENFFKFFKKYLEDKIIEIGGGHNSMSKYFQTTTLKKDCKIISFEPNAQKSKLRNHQIIKNFFDYKSVELNNIKDCNIVVHSHLFEHIYDPIKFLRLIKKVLKKGGYNIFSIPNIKKLIQNNQSNAMNFEHPYFLEEDLVDQLLRGCGFKIIKKKYFKSHSIFYQTKSINKIQKINYFKFNKNFSFFKKYQKRINLDIKNLNSKIRNKKYFIFGAHIFSQNLIFNNLNTDGVIGILDNDPEKINQFLYGTNFKVYKPNIIRKYKKPIIILRTGTYNNEIIRQLKLINNSTKII